MEGHELHVIKGAIKTLTNHKPWLVIEMNNSFNKIQSISQWDVSQLLIKLGYKTNFNISEKLDSTICLDIIFYHPFNSTSKEFNLNENAALRHLVDQNNLKRKITIEDLGFRIGPIINAGGRLNYSNYGVELLSSDDQKIIKDK